MRQEDVAGLAGLSTRYYAGFERGFTPGNSALAEKVARALRMSDAERSSLHVLSHGQDPPRPLTSPAPVTPRDDTPLRQLTAQLDPFPAALADETWTVLACNPAMTDWSGGWFSGQDRHLICFLFSPQAEQVLPDIRTLRKTYVAALRYQYCRNISSGRWPAVIECLNSSPAAARLWELHEVEFAPRGEKPWRLLGPGQEMITAQMYLVPYRHDRWIFQLVLPEGAPARRKPG